MVSDDWGWGAFMPRLWLLRRHLQHQLHERHAQLASSINDPAVVIRRAAAQLPLRNARGAVRRQRGADSSTEHGWDVQQGLTLTVAQQLALQQGNAQGALQGWLLAHYVNVRQGVALAQFMFDAGTASGAGAG